jgi:hypothetical protein
LQKIIGAYPNTDVKTRAQDILNLINNPRKETAPSADNQTADGQPKKKKKSSKEKTAYLLNTSVPHYVLVGFTKISSKNSTVMGQISNYNEKNHSIDNYETDQEMLNGRTQLFIIKQFKNADDATDYLDEIDNNLNLFKPLLPDDYQTVAISVENYSLLLESGELGEYRVFYEENYNR